MLHSNKQGKNKKVIKYSRQKCINFHQETFGIIFQNHELVKCIDLRQQWPNKNDLPFQWFFNIFRRNIRLIVYFTCSSKNRRKFKDAIKSFTRYFHQFLDLYQIKQCCNNKPELRRSWFCLVTVAIFWFFLNNFKNMRTSYSKKCEL